ncbi:hypothetical protein Cni_G23488 [Canna indica]|uniref:Uncharacterized protein n=1 Tax=Canna indica TaxID=4628 RepID=A0AAQ3KW93_9LILI|nr:hypothetical protein Cni_G23488 [Canna indica]
MASLVLILSELVRPEKVELLLNAANYPPNTSSAPSGGAVSATAFRKAMRSATKSMRPESARGDDEVFEEDLSEVKVSVESIWP